MFLEATIWKWDAFASKAWIIISAGAWKPSPTSYHPPPLLDKEKKKVDIGWWCYWPIKIGEIKERRMMTLKSFVKSSGRYTWWFGWILPKSMIPRDRATPSSLKLMSYLACYNFGSHKRVTICHFKCHTHTHTLNMCWNANFYELAIIAICEFCHLLWLGFS